MKRIIYIALFFVVACALLFVLMGEIKQAGMMPPCISGASLMLAALAVIGATAGRVR